MEEATEEEVVVVEEEEATEEEVTEEATEVEEDATEGSVMKEDTMAVVQNCRLQVTYRPVYPSTGTTSGRTRTSMRS